MSNPIASGDRVDRAGRPWRVRGEWSRASFLTSIVVVAAAGILFAGLFTAIGSDRQSALGWDFRATYYPAGKAVANRTSPYPPDVRDPALDARTVYAYPPALALLIAPLTRARVDVAAVVAVLASLGALMGALAIVGVRDVRCFAAVILWAPGWNALETANASALLALALAIAWRLRAVPLALGPALAVMVSIKLFLWPLFLWAAFTKRALATALGLVLGVAAIGGSWAVIGFAGLRAYPDLLDRVAKQESYSLRRVGVALGLSPHAAYIVTSVVALSMILLCVIWGRRGDEQRALLAGLGAALALTPVLWLHYLVLLAIPLAIFRPRFSPLWLLPVLLWVSPRSDPPGGWELCVPACVAVALIVALLRRPGASSARVMDRLDAGRTT